MFTSDYQAMYGLYSSTSDLKIMFDMPVLMQYLHVHPIIAHIDIPSNYCTTARRLLLKLSVPI